MKSNKSLMIGGIASAAASFLHITIIIGGPEWYRFFGAGEGMAQLAEHGSNFPFMVTAVIAIILATWAVYAFSGAGYLRNLPLIKPVLLVISMIYIVRGLFGIPMIFLIEHPYLVELQEKLTFMIISSLISFGIGLLYFIGWRQLWKLKTD